MFFECSAKTGGASINEIFHELTMKMLTQAEFEKENKKEEEKKGKDI